MLIPMEQQVINLEIAMELKKLGLWQQSLWYWQVNRRAHPTTERLVFGTTKKRNPKGFSYYAAFTAEEMAFILPEEIESKRKLFLLKIFQGGIKDWFCQYQELPTLHGKNPLEKLVWTDHNNLVLAMADLLVKLLRKKMLKVRDVNKDIKSRSVYVKSVFLRAKWARKRIKLGKPIYCVSEKSWPGIKNSKLAGLFTVCKQSLKQGSERTRES